MKLRPYQNAAISAIRNEYTKGVTKQLLSMSTGVGKTCVFSSLPEKLHDILPKQMLVLLHREELADQAIDKLHHINPELRIDKEMAEHKADPSLADVIVASVQSLGRKNTQRINKYNWENFDKFVVDEAHRSVAQSYMNVYESAGILKDGNKSLLLGVTATPVRGDGQGLAKLYQKIVYSYGLREAIEDKWLVDIRGVRVSTKTSLDGVKTVAGDYDAAQLADTVNTTERNQLVVKAWLESGENRHSLGFGVDIAHSKDLAEMFRNYGINADAVWGNDPNRSEKINKFRKGEILVLFNAQLLTEGFDLDTISCIILAAPTKSGVVFSQRIGRGTRLSPDKKDLLVLDLVDSSSRHSLITLPTLFGLNARLNLQGGSLLGATRKLEDAQAQYSHLDFTGLDDITKLEAYIESVDLFNIHYPEEVENNSELTWHRAVGGGYILLLNKEEKLQIQENLLGQWEVSATISGRRYRGSRDALGEAFQCADDLIHTQAPNALKIVKREGERWHNDPATPAQLKLLAKLLKGKKIPPDIDKKTASQVISSFFAKK